MNWKQPYSACHNTIGRGLAERLIASLDEPSEVKAAWVEEIAPARAQRSCRIL
jgi:hypothetical protein